MIVVVWAYDAVWILRVIWILVVVHTTRILVPGNEALCLHAKSKCRGGLSSVDRPVALISKAIISVSLR